MNRASELHDIRMTNDRSKRPKRRPLICYLPRGVRKVRNKRRQVDLIGLLVQSGAVRR